MYVHTYRVHSPERKKKGVARAKNAPNFIIPHAENPPHLGTLSKKDGRDPSSHASITRSCAWNLL